MKDFLRIMNRQTYGIAAWTLLGIAMPEVSFPEKSHGD